MSVPAPVQPNQAEPVTLQQLREAVAFIREHYGAVEDGVGNVFVWLWESIQGDFNLERSVGQISFDTAISMIPGVDQVCDVRDLIANCKHINEDSSDTWAWVALGLTLIGLFPVLGSLVKGVLKIFFLFVRRTGGRAIGPAVDEAMTWVITFLRRRDVQRYWRGLRIDHIFGELAKLTRQVRGQLSVTNLLNAFDRGIRLMRNLVDKVNRIPVVGASARSYLDMVLGVRRMANDGLRRALRPLQDVMDAIIRRLELEDLMHRGAIVDARNVHFRGTLPEARAVTLMRQADPLPSWLSRGEGRYQELDPASQRVRAQTDVGAANGYPLLSEGNVRSFHRMATHDVVGPAKLYRVTSPANGAAGEFWIDEATFHRLMQEADPKAAWRKHFAVWPDWNADGQFVVMEVPAGQTLKTWRGPAASQTKDSLKGLHLEGGWDQILMKPTSNEFDTTRYYMRGGSHGERLHSPGLSREEWMALSESKRSAYHPMREQINDTRISGPYDTGWGVTDFDPQLRDARVGLPALPGQITRNSTP